VNLVFGLIGAGTNTFTVVQRNIYLQKTDTLYTGLLEALESGRDSAPAPMNFSGKGAAVAVNEWILRHESSLLGDGEDPGLRALAAHILSLYGPQENDRERRVQAAGFSRAELCAFINDMQRVDYLIRLLEEEGLAVDRASPNAEGSAAAFIRIRDFYAAPFEEALQRISVTEP
jgi:hypothetical protein